MTQPYLFLSFTALLLTPGTRKRPPQSGSVQTGFQEIGTLMTNNAVTLRLPITLRTVATPSRMDR
jgi:hypothetical protein